MQETYEMQVWSLGWEDPLEEGMATHSSILFGKSHGQRSLAGYSPWGHKESDTTEATERAHMLFLIHAKEILMLMHWGNLSILYNITFLFVPINLEGVPRWY